ncbi:hypothetical protein OIU85_004050 [Salix viminalis]|uniref:Pentatricopeptide repeat-containing protein n=1 Tax=Salix viminalis TaxID=40686 RepID=A0A9Q0PSJ2_SALVM|nr:hypothetical protein OIU85_004050 [Salix viminalis]
MQKSAVKPNLVVYTILIDGMCKCGKLKDARVLFSRLTVEGFQPDVHTYTVLIGGIYAATTTMLLDLPTDDGSPALKNLSGLCDNHQDVKVK